MVLSHYCWGIWKRGGVLRDLRYNQSIGKVTTTAQVVQSNIFAELKPTTGVR